MIKTKNDRQLELRQATARKLSFLNALSCERSHTEVHVAVRLLHYLNHDKGFAWPSIRRLAIECNCSKRTVQRAIDGLVEDGWFVVDRGRGRGRTNRYAPNFSRLEGKVAPHKKNMSELSTKGDIGVPKKPTQMSSDSLKQDPRESSRRQAADALLRRLLGLMPALAVIAATRRMFSLPKSELDRLVLSNWNDELSDAELDEVLGTGWNGGGL